VFSIWAVGSIPPAGTIDFNRLNPVLRLSEYPPRIRAPILTSKILLKTNLNLFVIFSA